MRKEVIKKAFREGFFYKVAQNPASIIKGAVGAGHVATKVKTEVGQALEGALGGGVGRVVVEAKRGWTEAAKDLGIGIALPLLVADFVGILDWFRGGEEAQLEKVLDPNILLPVLGLGGGGLLLYKIFSDIQKARRERARAAEIRDIVKLRKGPL